MNEILKNAREVYKTKDSDFYLETIRKTADELEQALTELSEIKQRAEEMRKNLIGEYSYIEIIDYIIKGEWE